MSWSFTDKKIQLFGEKIRQSWADLFFLNRVLSNYKFNDVIELGTGHGMLSVFLAMHHDGVLYTVDNRGRPINYPFGASEGPFSMEFINGDCLSEPIIKRLSKVIQNGRVLVYCDGGDKPSELRAYSEYLQEGDVIMCHDRGAQECQWSDLEETVRANRLQLFHDEEARSLGASIWSFIKGRIDG